MSGRVCIKTFLNRFEAPLAQGFLESNGIEAIVASDDAGSMQPNLSYLSNIRLMVNESDAQQALAMLDDCPTE